MADTVFIGLSDQSRAVIEQYFAWNKTKREKFDRELEFESGSFATGNILDQMMSRDEVRMALTNHLNLLKSSLGKEQHYQSIAAAQLMRSVLLEADKQRIPIPVNTMEVLNNMGSTSALEAAESRMFSQPPKGKLAPLTGVDTGNETAKQLAAAHNEIRALNDRLRKQQEQLELAMADRANVHSQSSIAQQEAAMMAQNASLQSQQSMATTQTLEIQLQQVKMELLQAQKEMADRLAKSAQFQNLQQMLRQKNEVVKMMRAELSRYDPAAAARIAGNVDDVVEDEDED